MSDDIKALVNDLYDQTKTASDRIARWYALVPKIQDTLRSLEWVKESMINSPDVISISTDERLMDYLSLAQDGVAFLKAIPEPDPGISSFISTSGSAIPDAFYDYVVRLSFQFQGNQEVADWSKATIVAGRELKEKENRSEKVHRRLAQLGRRNLDGMHSTAIRLCLRAQIDKDEQPIGAAAALTNLIDQFKGVLISYCKNGEKSTYQRIADNLAGDSNLARSIVKDGEDEYRRIYDELVEIRKQKAVSSGDRIFALLRRIEDHFFIITNALDPMKIGINFE